MSAMVGDDRVRALVSRLSVGDRAAFAARCAAAVAQLSSSDVTAADYAARAARAAESAAHSAEYHSAHRADASYAVDVEIAARDTASSAIYCSTLAAEAAYHAAIGGADSYDVRIARAKGAVAAAFDAQISSEEARS